MSIIPYCSQMVSFPLLLSGASDASATLVAISAYDQSTVTAHGYSTILSWLTLAGADGVEIRRELLPVGFEDFIGLGRTCADLDLAVIYSAPERLWEVDRFAADLDKQIVEAAALGAVAIKVPMGHYPGENQVDWVALSERLAAAPPLLIENDQTPEGGTLEPLAACLEDASSAGCPLGMTFDMGNWLWTSTDPLEAARRLGPFIRYLHCKGVVSDHGQLEASVPDERELSALHSLLTYLPAQLPRAIEYPLRGENLLAITAEQLTRLRHL